MRSLAEVLVHYLEDEVRQRASQRNGRLQLVFVGPPTSLLDELFDLLTRSGTSDWQVDGVEGQVVVLLVDGERQSMQSGSARSARANWDYAVTMRHGERNSVILVGPDAWQDQPESIENASDRLGHPGASTARGFVQNDPWPFLLRWIERGRGYPAPQVARTIRDLWRDSMELNKQQREELPWLAADDLLSGAELSVSVGLPRLAEGIPLAESIRRGRQALVRLAKACASEGFTEVEQRFQNARGERRAREEREVGSPSFLDSDTSISAMFSYLRVAAGSGGAFSRSPSLFFRLNPAVEPWWNDLTNEVLDDLLTATDAPMPRARVVLEVETMVPPAQDEPCVVTDEVKLIVLEKTRTGRQPVEAASVFRRCPEENRQWTDVEEGRVVDDEVPEHSRPITYQAAVSGHLDARVRVIALNKFACHGHAHVNAALRNPAPARRSRGSAPYEQLVVVRQSGIHHITVLVSDDVAKVALTESDTEPKVSPVLNNKAEFTFHVERDTQTMISLLDSNNAKCGSWGLAFEVEEATRGVVHSQFDDLVLSHQEGERTRVVTARPCQARELESAAMEDDHGYRGLVACWRSEGTAAGPVDWQSCRVGEIHVPEGIDPRPLTARQEPPTAYLEARKRVVEYLSGYPDQYVCEIPLAGPEPERLAGDYLRAYAQWLRDAPDAASWVECIAVYAENSSAPSAVETVSDEPIVLLLTPLHPLRFAWHAHAQSLLKEGLEHKCPLVGLLSPHHTPSITALPIWFGQQQPEWRSFLGVPCEDKHWAVMVNGTYFHHPLLADAFAALRRLGLAPQGVTGGMSVSQTKRALDDVAGILCAKAVLRIGLTGSPQERAGSVDGLLEWVEQGFRLVEPTVEAGVSSDEAESMTLSSPVNPVSIEVFDFRGASAHPSDAALANLSEDIDARIRWFHGVGRSVRPAMDLVVFDQVGTTTERLQESKWAGQTRSVLGRGGLFRVNIRADQGAGRLIAEARVGRQRHPGHDLAACLSETIQGYEELAMRGGATHLEFSPNRQELEGWMQSARFLAASSSQIDPACFIRALGDRGDYLWDYDLPNSVGTDSGSAGYYLIARPRDSMKDAVSRSLTVIVDPPPPADAFLAEISKRGIPILKRLASGGARSKGEVGALLAVRLLQDAFRANSSGLRLPVVEGNCIHMLLAVDSYQAPLSSIRKAIVGEHPMKRPDLVIFAIQLREEGVKIKVTPLEVKFYTTIQNSVLTDAVGQADSLAQTLKSLWSDQPRNSLWDACGRALLARCLDECFRIYADPQLHQMEPRAWARIHEGVLEEVLGVPDLSSVVSINRGRLLAFSPAFQHTRLASMDGDDVQESLLVDTNDARVLITGNGQLSAAATDGVTSLGLSHPNCGLGTISMIMAERGEGTLEANDYAQSPPSGDATVANGASDSGEMVENSSAPESAPGPTVGLLVDREDTYTEQTEQDPDGGDSLQRSGGTVPPEVRQQVREAFIGFIGNEKPVRRITRDLLVALTSDPPNLPRNYLLVGLPSVGKTELARRIARALTLPFVKLDGTALNAREKLFDLIDGQLGKNRQPERQGEDAGQPVFRYPPFVVFVDEVHLVPRRVQESLLTMLETKDRTVRLEHRVVEVPEATFIFATTQDSSIDKAFKSRCSEIHLSPYSIAQVAEMVMDHVRQKGVDPAGWDPEVFPKMARLGRLIPRRAFEVANELMDELRTTEQPELPIAEHLRIVQEMMDVDGNGLGRLDLEYLEVLDRAGRPLGEEAITTMLGTVDKDKIVEEVEPLLRRLNLIMPGVRGREITREGREYIATHRANS